MPKAKIKLPKGAIGLKEDFTEEELAGKHIGRGGFVFDTEDDYLNHVSPETGYTPKDFEHQNLLTGGRFGRISEKAIARGKEVLSKTKKKK